MPYERVKLRVRHTSDGQITLTPHGYAKDKCVGSARTLGEICDFIIAHRSIFACDTFWVTRADHPHTAYTEDVYQDINMILTEGVEGCRGLHTRYPDTHHEVRAKLLTEVKRKYGNISLERIGE